MQKSMNLTATARLWAIAGMACLFGPGWAWAGGGGADLGFVKQVLTTMVCPSPFVNLGNCPQLPPQLPTVNQVIVEISALTGSTPNFVRTDPSFGIFIAPGVAFDAGTLTGLANPLAFISALNNQGTNNQGTPIPTATGNPAANSFLSATTTPIANPTTLNLTFDYRSRTTQTFAAGQDIGDIVLPIAVADANGNLVRDVTATLEIRGAGGTSITTDIVGDFLGTGMQTEQLSDLGMTFSLNFSPNAIFSVDIPLLITSDLTPAYLISASGHEFAPGLFDGIDPVASFLNANFINDGNDLLAAVKADLAIAFNGTTILSDPVPTPEPSTLMLVGGSVLALGLLLRRRAAIG